MSLIVYGIETGCVRQQKYRIGISQCSSNDWRTKMNEEIEREVLFHDNVEIEIRSADDSSDKQIADLQYFVDNKFDLIIVAPNEAEALTNAVTEIYERGIPIVVFDRTINQDKYTAFQGADNTEIGKQAAMLAFSMLGDSCRVIEICGLEGSSPAAERQRGFDNKAKEMGISLLGRGFGNWNAREGRLVAESLLLVHPQANLIFAHNDRMAIAASLEARKQNKSLKVIGIDAAPTIGIPAVADSVIDATFLYPIGGHQLIRTALAILEGEPYERSLILPSPSAVDSTNAEILLPQDKALREETDKMGMLKSRIDNYWAQHESKTLIHYVKCSA